MSGYVQRTVRILGFMRLGVIGKRTENPRVGGWIPAWTTALSAVFLNTRDSLKLKRSLHWVSWSSPYTVDLEEL